MATIVFNNAVYLPGSTPVRVKALGSTPWVDPVLNVLDPSGNSVAFSDDAPGLVLNSEVSFTTPMAGWYRIVVHGFQPSTAGTGDVYLDLGLGYSLFASSASFGGTKFAATAPTITYQTALRPYGTDDTVLYLLDPDGRVLAWDDDSGVGLASYYWNLVGPVEYAVLGAFSTPGTADLYLNDSDGGAYTDHDTDWIGRGLEQELGSCDDLDDTGCADVFNLRDADHDGIIDRYELFGMDVWPPQELPRWGANILAKDVFIEADYLPPAPPSFVSSQLSETQMQQCADIYAAGPQAHLRNRSGDGVRLHFDVGGGAWCADQTLCGNWGGASETTTASMDPVRVGMFIHALLDPAAGSASPESVPVRTAAGPFCHELGHKLNLSHEGGPMRPWPHPLTQLQVNCKPNYKSIMNYGFSGRPVGLSLGDERDINPSRASETRHYYEYEDTTALETIFPRNSGTFFPALHEIDWNRDGFFTDIPAVHLRAGVTHMKAGCNAGGIGATGYARAPQAVTPDLVTFPHDSGGERRLYAFYVSRGDDRLYYMHAPVAGPTVSGSCAEPTGPCHSMSSSVMVGAVGGPVRSLTVEDWGGKLVVAYTDSFQTVWVVTGVQEPGGTISWAAAEAVEGGLDPGTEPELAVLRVAPGGQYGAVNEVLALFFVKSGIHRMRWANTGLETWQFGSVLDDASGAEIPGTVAASVTAWPPRGSLPWPDYSSDGTMDARNCAIFPNANRIARFYCTNRATGRWVDMSAGFDSAAANIKLIGRPALAYHVSRWNEVDLAQPLPPVLGSDTANGQFWFVGVPDVPTDVDAHRNPVYWVTKTNRRYPGLPPVAAMQWTSMNEWRDDWSHAYSDTSGLGLNSGLSLYEDGNLSSLKAAWLPKAEEVEIQPFADGTANIDLHDYSDFKILERGICAAVRGPPPAGDSFCGSYLESYWGY